MGMTQKLLVVMSVIAGIYTSSSACCFASLFGCSSTDYSSGGQTGYIVSVGQLICEEDVPPKIYTDTIFKSDMLSILKTKYDSSDVVVLATVKSAKVYTPKIDPEEEVLWEAESISICFDTILKGNVPKREWNFSKDRIGTAFLTACDADSCYITQTIYTGVIEESYLPVVGRKYLLFFKKEDLEGAKVVINLGVPTVCDTSSYAYLVDSANNVRFDGYAIDTSTNTVLAVPDMKVTVDQMIKFEIPVTPSAVKYKTTSVQRSIINTPITSYNLLGKRMPSNSHIQQTKLSPVMQIYTGSQANGKAQKRTQVR
jgi:hypothetical protein